MKKKSATTIALPTLALFLVCVLGFIGNIYCACAEIYSMSVAFGVSTLLLYLSFTPLHEASHGNIFFNSKILNTIAGHIIGFIFLAPYSAFRKLHLQHHAHVNNPDKDPDHWVKGSNAFYTFLRILSIYFSYYYSHLKDPKTRIKNLTATIPHNTLLLASFTFLGLSISPQFVFFVWIIPSVCALSLVAFFFDFLPHYPHDDSSKENNSRTYLSRPMAIIMLGHNRHIIHHLYPRVPFYNYAEHFENLPEKYKKGHTRIYSTPTLLRSLQLNK